MPDKKPPAEARSLRDFILQTEQRFARAGLYFGHGTDNARDEAAWLVSSTLGIPFTELEAHAARVLTGPERQIVLDLAEARVNTRKPLAYLLHEAWFAGLKFYVDERVIVPRSLIGDSINDQFQPWIAPARVHRVLDLCTGSGCIAIAAAIAFPQTQVDAVDISGAALEVARINVKQHGLAERVRLIQSDLFQGLKNERYDLILSNPPYVDVADMAALPDEYRHEPELALASGKQGLDAIVRILSQAAAHLNPDGALIAEVGNSCAALQTRFPEVPFVWLTNVDGDESVFLLSAAELARHAARFNQASDFL